MTERTFPTTDISTFKREEREKIKSTIDAGIEKCQIWKGRDPYDTTYEEWDEWRDNVSNKEIIEMIKSCHRIVDIIDTDMNTIINNLQFLDFGRGRNDKAVMELCRDAIGGEWHKERNITTKRAILKKCGILELLDEERKEKIHDVADEDEEGKKRKVSLCDIVINNALIMNNEMTNRNLRAGRIDPDKETGLITRDIERMCYEFPITKHIDINTPNGKQMRVEVGVEKEPTSEGRMGWARILELKKDTYPTDIVSTIEKIKTTYNNLLKKEGRRGILIDYLKSCFMDMLYISRFIVDKFDYDTIVNPTIALSERDIITFLEREGIKYTKEIGWQQVGDKEECIWTVPISPDAIFALDKNALLEAVENLSTDNEYKFLLEFIDKMKKDENFVPSKHLLRMIEEKRLSVEDVWDDIERHREDEYAKQNPQSRIENTDKYYNERYENNPTIQTYFPYTTLLDKHASSILGWAELGFPEYIETRLANQLLQHVVKVDPEIVKNVLWERIEEYNMDLEEGKIDPMKFSFNWIYGFINKYGQLADILKIKDYIEICKNTGLPFEEVYENMDFLLDAVDGELVYNELGTSLWKISADTRNMIVRSIDIILYDISKNNIKKELFGVSEENINNGIIEGVPDYYLWEGNPENIIPDTIRTALWYNEINITLGVSHDYWDWHATWRVKGGNDFIPSDSILIQSISHAIEYDSEIEDYRDVFLFLKETLALPAEMKWKEFVKYIIPHMAIGFMGIDADEPSTYRNLVYTLRQPIHFQIYLNIWEYLDKIELMLSELNSFVQAELGGKVINLLNSINLSDSVVWNKGYNVINDEIGLNISKLIDSEIRIKRILEGTKLIINFLSMLKDVCTIYNLNYESIVGKFWALEPSNKYTVTQDGMQIYNDLISDQIQRLKPLSIGDNVEVIYGVNCLMTGKVYKIYDHGIYMIRDKRDKSFIYPRGALKKTT